MIVSFVLIFILESRSFLLRYLSLFCSQNALIEALPMDVVESISSIPASRDHKSRKACSRSQEKSSSLRTFRKGCQWIEFIDMDPQSISHRQRSLLAQLSMNCTAADRGMDALDSSLQESEEPRNSFSCVVRVTSPLFVQILCERCNGFLMIRFRISSPSEENSASGQDCLAHCPIRSIPGIHFLFLSDALSLFIHFHIA